MTVFHYGMTGTQIGMTALQHQGVTGLLTKAGDFVAHHGDCIGSDEEFHRICLTLPGCLAIVIHPPIDPKKRAFCDRITGQVPVTVLPMKEYIPRNHDIVKVVQRMIATPKEARTEVTRSGTWSTIRFAQQKQRPLALVWPDGQIRYEEWPE